MVFISKWSSCIARLVSSQVLHTYITDWFCFSEALEFLQKKFWFCFCFVEPKVCHTLDFTSRTSEKWLLWHGLKANFFPIKILIYLTCVFPGDDEGLQAGASDLLQEIATSYCDQYKNQTDDSVPELAFLYEVPDVSAL